MLDQATITLNLPSAPHGLPLQTRGGVADIVEHFRRHRGGAGGDRLIFDEGGKIGTAHASMVVRDRKKKNG